MEMKNYAAFIENIYLLSALALLLYTWIFLLKVEYSSLLKYRCSGPTITDNKETEKEVIWGVMTFFPHLPIKVDFNHRYLNTKSTLYSQVDKVDKSG